MHRQSWIFLLLTLLLWVFLSAGCAHRPKTSSKAVPTDVQLQQNRPKNTAGTSPSKVDTDNKGIDDDIFEDEFEEKKVRVADPFSLWNRAMFTFNDKLYFTVLKPLAVAYREITPEMIRTGIRNFFRNLTAPIRMVNCVLQGKKDAFAVESTRFVLNTTVGVLGLGSPADGIPDLVRPDEEDFGQTLAKYGIGNGFYIVWPVFGPSTLRDTFGRLGDWAMNPINYIDTQEASIAIWSVDRVNQTSFRIGDYEAFRKAAVDPYVALRDAYIQLRETKVRK